MELQAHNVQQLEGEVQAALDEQGIGRSATDIMQSIKDGRLSADDPDVGLRAIVASTKDWLRDHR